MIRGLLLSLVLCSLFVVGCGPSTASITPGMSVKEADRELSRTWPPTLLSGVRLKPDGTFRRVFSQNRGTVTSFVVVEDREGVVTQVEYVAR